ncbi:MAG: hypothetical protein R2686_03515 [Candidatus Nanopelagicales bacterium]
MTTSPHVGTLREKPLHADLKRWYAEPADTFEQPVDGFVIDIVRGDLLIEIQTRSFSSMKRKLTALLPHHHVRMVHPIAVEQWIVKVDDAGEILSRRKSPKRGAAHDLFSELVSFPEMLSDAHLSLEILFVRTQQVRRFDPTRAWRRKGWVVEENQLLEVTGSLEVESGEDLAELLPEALPDEFTTADLAGALRCSRRLAQQMAYCLRRTGGIEAVGKDGRAVLYRRSLHSSAPTN